MLQFLRANAPKNVQTMNDCSGKPLGDTCLARLGNADKDIEDKNDSTLLTHTGKTLGNHITRRPLICERDGSHMAVRCDTHTGEMQRQTTSGRDTAAPPPLSLPAVQAKGWLGGMRRGMARTMQRSMAHGGLAGHTRGRRKCMAAVPLFELAACRASACWLETRSRQVCGCCRSSRPVAWPLPYPDTTVAGLLCDE